MRLRCWFSRFNVLTFRMRANGRLSVSRINAGNRIIPAIEPRGAFFGGGSLARAHMRGGIIERVQSLQQTVGGTMAACAGIRWQMYSPALFPVSRSSVSSEKSQYAADEQAPWRSSRLSDYSAIVAGKIARQPETYTHRYAVAGIIRATALIKEHRQLAVCAHGATGWLRVGA